ncbi:hypothetical protein C0993_008310 [Termitomyces sp. T159_Od127]|nr:hypothetical protein C0993_008310 [Termitomyces sp. T159_Od127]
MSPRTAYSSASEPKEGLRTRNFESPQLIQLQDEDAYSLPLSSNIATEARPRSPLQSIMQNPSPPSSQSLGSDSLHSNENTPPASERERSESVASNKSEEKVEKRKRSRVTPEQLQRLERFFSLDRNPTASRRREISQMLGMQERQTQIWFQNRRAKARLPDGKQQRHRRVTVEIPPPDSPPQLSASIQVDLHNLIHEDDGELLFDFKFTFGHTERSVHDLTAVTIIPCTDLYIGSWRRISTIAAKHDLVAYVSDVKRCLTWYIHSEGFGFKMEIPFNTIVETKLTNVAPGSGLASFILSEPPLFYLENIGPSSTDGNPQRYWKRGLDWTEGQQASRVLRHDLIGSAPQLSHLLRNLRNMRNQVPTDIPLLQPSYQSNQNIAPVSGLELPPPPLANLMGPGMPYEDHNVLEPSVSHHDNHFGKRSTYGVSPGVSPSSDVPYSNEGDRPPPYSAPSSMSFSFTEQQQNSQQSRRSSGVFGTNGGAPYSGFERPILHRSHSADNFLEVPISHNVAPRPYSAQAIPRSFYNDTSYHSTSQSGIQPHHTQGEDSQIHRANTPLSTTSGYTTHEQLIPPHLDPRHQQHIIMQNSPSPPLLTTPYHPPPHLFNRPVHTDHLGSGTSPLHSSPLHSSYSSVDYQAQ